MTIKETFPTTVPASADCYDVIELLCPADTEYVEVITPDAQVVRVYPFCYQPIKITYLETGIEQIASCGSPQLHIRYTPVCAGNYTLFACNDTFRQCLGTCSVATGYSHGYIGVSKNDSHYFAYTDGTPFLPLGINLCWPTMYRGSNGAEYGRLQSWNHSGLRQYEEWMRALSEAGCNLIRIWAGIDLFCPESERAGEFDYGKFTVLDTIFAFAQKYNIKIKLTLDQFRFLDYSDEPILDEWTDFVHSLVSKRLYHGEECCPDMNTFLREEKWKNLWLLKIHEYALRYASCPNLFAVELWNEMNALHCDRDLLISWNIEMAPKVQKLFPNTMIINSLGSLDCDANDAIYRKFPFEDFAFSQVHRYLDMGAPWDVCHSDMFTLVTDSVKYIQNIQTKNAPVFLAETGAVEACHSGPFRYYQKDHRGILFVDAVYTPIFLGAAGSGNIWHWDDYVECKNIYNLFEPLEKLTYGIAFDKQNFVSKTQEDDNAYILLLEGDQYILGYVRNKQDNWKQVLRDNLSPEPIDVTISVSENGTLTVIPLWESFGVSETPGCIHFQNMHYGALFRIDKK